MEYTIRPILHAGEGPVDMRRMSRTEAIGYPTREMAVIQSAKDAIVAEIGQPVFDDGGSDAIPLYFAADDENGVRKCYRATATLQINVTLEEVPEPK